MPDPKLLTLEQAATRLGLEVATLEWCAAAGVLETTAVEGQQVTCLEWLTLCIAECREWLDDCTGPTWLIQYAPLDKLQGHQVDGLGGLYYVLATAMMTADSWDQGGGARNEPQPMGEMPRIIHTREMSTGQKEWAIFGALAARAALYPGDAREAFALLQGARRVYDRTQTNRRIEERDISSRLATREDRRQTGEHAALERHYERIRWDLARLGVERDPEPLHAEAFLVWCVEKRHHPETGARVSEAKGWDAKAALLGEYVASYGGQFILGSDAGFVAWWRERVNVASRRVRIVALYTLYNVKERRRVWGLDDSANTRAQIKALQRKWLSDALKPLRNVSDSGG